MDWLDRLWRGGVVALGGLITLFVVSYLPVKTVLILVATVVSAGLGLVTALLLRAAHR